MTRLGVFAKAALTWQMEWCHLAGNLHMTTDHCMLYMDFDHFRVLYVTALVIDPYEAVVKIHMSRVLRLFTFASGLLKLVTLHLELRFRRVA